MLLPFKLPVAICKPYYWVLETQGSFDSFFSQYQFSPHCSNLLFLFDCKVFFFVLKNVRELTIIVILGTDITIKILYWLNKNTIF
jgi:hypothetical protein